MNTENSINPFDDLYDVDVVKEYFGIDAITYKRAQLEVRYWKLISEILFQRRHIKKEITPRHFKLAADIANTFRYSSIQKHLATTKHEIKALEYALRDEFVRAGVPNDELIHWGLTSQDIVDPVYTLSIKGFIKNEIGIRLTILNETIQNVSEQFGESSKFPARTHGQLAIPTTMQHEFEVYNQRLARAMYVLSSATTELRVKFGGAIGTLAVHRFVDPSFNWEEAFDKMFRELWFIHINPYTTQVNGNDDKAAVFAALVGINNILIDFCQDIWLYFSYGYLTIQRDKQHVGSSTMVQKNNPIEFENVEGMLQLANSDLHFMMDKLTRSRGQRDLSDSVVQRFYGLMFAKMWHAYTKLTAAVEKLQFVPMVGTFDIADNHQVHGELIQSLCKLAGQDKFEEIKHLFNKKHMNVSDFMEIVSAHLPEFKEKIIRDCLNS